MRDADPIASVIRVQHEYASRFAPPGGPPVPVLSSGTGGSAGGYDASDVRNRLSAPGLISFTETCRNAQRRRIGDDLHGSIETHTPDQPGESAGNHHSVACVIAAGGSPRSTSTWLTSASAPARPTF